MKKLSQAKLQNQEKNQIRVEKVEVKKTRYVAQCCAKQSKIISGCHD